jgi:DNA-directed RNA polymerase specialized sigma24 family protein
MTAEQGALFEPDSQLIHPDYAEHATIQERFEAFHAANPWVYRALEHLTIQRLSRGRRRVGIAALFEVLRWEWEKSTVGGGFKLNNDFRSRYVRLLLERHPEWDGVFETRQLKAA